MLLGMFDTIICKYPLPRPIIPMELEKLDFNSLNYQTKCLENCLNYYEIREDGTLWVERTESEHVEGDKNSKTFSGRFGYFKTIKSWWEPVSDFTGSVEFYESYGFGGSANPDLLNNDYWVEYKALFILGKINTIDLVKFQATNNTERKVRDTEWKTALKNKNELWNRWYIKYGYRYYDSLVHWIFRRWNFLTRKLPASFIVERWLRPL